VNGPYRVAQGASLVLSPENPPFLPLVDQDCLLTEKLFLPGNGNDIFSGSQIKEVVSMLVPLLVPLFRLLPERRAHHKF